MLRDEGAPGSYVKIHIQITNRTSAIYNTNLKYKIYNKYQKRLGLYRNKPIMIKTKNVIADDNEPRN